MGVNEKLLRETLQYIKDHPAEHYQQEWRCESGLCFAGIAAVTLSGGVWEKPLSTPDEWALQSIDSPYVKAETDDVPGGFTRFAEVGTSVHVADRAIRLLGLDTEQAVRLFNSGNRLADLERLVRELCEEDDDATENGG